jgi:hypothetical protein
MMGLLSITDSTITGDTGGHWTNVTSQGRLTAPQAPCVNRVRENGCVYCATRARWNQLHRGRRGFWGRQADV